MTQWLYYRANVHIIIAIQEETFTWLPFHFKHAYCPSPSRHVLTNSYIFHCKDKQIHTHPYLHIVLSLYICFIWCFALTKYQKSFGRTTSQCPNKLVIVRNKYKDTREIDSFHLTQRLKGTLSWHIGRCSRLSKEARWPILSHLAWNVRPSPCLSREARYFWPRPCLPKEALHT